MAIPCRECGEELNAPGMDICGKCRDLSIGEIKKEDLTCNKCDIVDECPVAWDPYNTNGDCLNK